MAKKPRIAGVADPAILAAVRGYFQYEHEWQAAEMLEKIHNDYVRSKDSTPQAVKLWVRGFNVTKEEKAQNFRGNFASMKVAPAEGGKWTITAQKTEVPLDKHPEKERPKAAHPNWGHPVLRAVESGKKFDGIAIARAFLQSLHHEYPDVTIPGKDVVRVMVYKREESGGGGIQKIAVKVKPLSDGGAKLVIMKPKVKSRSPVQLAPTAEQPTEGKFTVMVKKRRKPLRS